MGIYLDIQSGHLNYPPWKSVQHLLFACPLNNVRIRFAVYREVGPDPLLETTDYFVNFCYQQLTYCLYNINFSTSLPLHLKILVYTLVYPNILISNKVWLCVNF